MKVLLIFLFGLTAPAIGVEFQSTEARVSLIELYTSEGCSSCPPADKWFSSLKERPDLWKRFVPIGLHVDYWNYLGWSDRFSSRDYTRRQRQYSSEWKNSRVYTPGFVVNGDEWRGSYDGNAQIPASTQKVGVLTLRIDKQQAIIHFSPTQDNRGVTVTIALLKMNELTQVRSGENGGRTLKHDFSVIQLVEVPLTGQSNNYRAKVELPKNVKFEAIAAWVSRKGSQKPLQAVGGYVN